MPIFGEELTFREEFAAVAGDFPRQTLRQTVTEAVRRCQPRPVRPVDRPQDPETAI
jgi:hypothetical protein